ncbi:helix-turn-helix transcriptional regulator [Rhodococcus sovatensis]|uniref:Helix-turn-helix transcriptional regulator n=1 Tax=Rhodococcus sovatensis TaxID=1805840 RepID=A0ABZ2PNS4_9NOCA
MTGSALGEYLRTARSRVQPEDAGLTTFGPRRVAGLRREEVAVLAGMNSDYYARLEQGRENRPSPQILDALCDALQLDEHARDHLYTLAGVVPSTRRLPVDVVDPSLRQLLDGYHDTPAFVLNPALDILVVNDLCRALFSPFSAADNLAYMTFLDPAGSSFYGNWTRSAENVVASLRHATGSNAGYPRLNEVIDALLVASAGFSDLWRRPDVREKSKDSKQLVHPDVGELNLIYHTFDVRGSRGQQLVVYSAPPGSSALERLTLLGTLHARYSQ